MMLDLFGNAISSPGSASGASPPASPASVTTRPYGQDHALANLSARQAKALGLLTSGTSGPHSTISSNNAALRSSLASKLRELTETLGSTLYRLTWTQKRMPSGLLKPALAASVRPISEAGTIGSLLPSTGSEHLANWHTPVVRDHPNSAGDGSNPRDNPRLAPLASWPTTRAADGEKNVRTLDGSLSEIARKGGVQDLAMGAALTGWGTPLTKAGARSPEFAEGREPNLHEGAQLASWTTPSATDGERGGTITSNMTGTSLTQQVNMAMAPWTTPLVHDTNPRGSGNRNNPKAGGACLAWDARSTVTDGPARLTVIGAMLIGSDAGTRSGGQLSPAHSLWLMLGPFATAWASCGERVTRSTSRKRKASLLPSDTLSSSGDA